MKAKRNSPLYYNVAAATALAVLDSPGMHSFDSIIQRKVVQLVSAIRTLRKHSLNPGNKIPCYCVLGKIEDFIGDWWSFLWDDGENVKRVEEHRLCISQDEFSARLTKANVCNWSHNATFLCDGLLEIRENPTLFAAALSAPAQPMLHTALNVYSFCKTHRTSRGQAYRWGEWKTVFKEADTVENVEARNDAVSAVVAVETAKRAHNSIKKQGKRHMIAREMSKQSGQSRDFDGQPQQKNMTVIGRGRGIDEAFQE